MKLVRVMESENEFTDQCEVIVEENKQNKQNKKKELYSAIANIIPA
jgi:hypothetical protein